MGPVAIESTAGVFRIALRRPEVHNALNEEAVESLRQAVEQAASDREVRVVVLSGEGPSFCAGADLAWMKEMGEAGEEENRQSAERLARLFLALDRLEKPLLGRIHGAALGGGAGLAAVCDVAIASTRSTFSLSEARLGLIPAVIAPYVVRKVGSGRARELMLTARRFDGQEAQALGLVARAVDESLLDSAVEKTIRDVMACGPGALARLKKLLREIDEKPRRGEELASWTAAEIADCRASAEARAGVQAFLEKKAPPWAAGGPGP